MNTLTYALQSRYARPMLKQTMLLRSASDQISGALDEYSFPVAIAQHAMFVDIEVFSTEDTGIPEEDDVSSNSTSSNSSASPMMFPASSAPGISGTRAAGLRALSF